jgi:hypothetical protein
MRAFGTGVVVLVAAAGATHAHLALDQPESRYGPNTLKDGPCGRIDGERSGNVTVLEPGATIEVVFREYINHPGHFRIAFDADGDDDFRDPPCLSHCESRTDASPPVFGEYSDATVLLDAIPDTQGGESRITVTLPDVECERCTLQVIQVMYDKRPITSPGNDLYYQCADLVLRRAATGESDAGPETGPETGPEVDEVVEVDEEDGAGDVGAEAGGVEAAGADEGCGAGGLGSLACTGLVMVGARAWRRRTGRA